MNKKQKNLSDDYFGSAKKLREYHILFNLGLIMMLIGVPFLFLPGNWIVPGIVLIFIGFICLITGWLGKREETQKAGMKRISTGFGKAAFAFGVLSVFVSNGPYIALIFGVLAIILSYKSIKKGDNEYGLAGGLSGVIGIIVNLYVTVLFTYFH